MQIISLEHTPESHNSYCHDLLKVCSSLKNLNWSGQESNRNLKRTICTLYFLHTCDLQKSQGHQFYDDCRFLVSWRFKPSQPKDVMIIQRLKDLAIYSVRENRNVQVSATKGLTPLIT